MADHTKLIQAALAAREQAHAPYSKFKVGAALQISGGITVTGANVERCGLSRVFGG